MVNIWLICGEYVVHMWLIGYWMGFGIPQNLWFIRENPIWKWMMTGGTPILGNPHMKIMKLKFECRHTWNHWVRASELCVSYVFRSLIRREMYDVKKRTHDLLSVLSNMFLVRWSGCVAKPSIHAMLPQPLRSMFGWPFDQLAQSKGLCQVVFGTP